MAHVSSDEFARIARMKREQAATRKEKRADKRVLLGLGKKARPSLWKWWAEKCDGLWGQAVRARDMAQFGDVCRIRKAKNCTGRNECGYHLVSKARGHAIRWLLKAGVAACNACNKGEQMNRTLYAEYHKELFGADFMQYLTDISHLTVKYDVPGLKDLAQSFLKIIQDFRIKTNGHNSD